MDENFKEFPVERVCLQCTYFRNFRKMCFDISKAIFLILNLTEFKPS